MNDPVRRSNSALALSAVTLLQSVAPAAVAVGCLYALLGLFGQKLSPYFHLLALVVALLSAVLLRLPRTSAGQLFGGSFPLIIAVLSRWLILLALLLAVGYATKFSAYYSRRVVLSWSFLAPALVILATLALRDLQRRLLRDPANLRKAVIAGYTESSRALAQRLLGRNGFGISVLGFFDDRGSERLNVPGDLPLLGRLADLVDFVKRNGVDVTFVALPVRNVSRVTDLVDQLQDTTVSIYYLPDIYVFDLIQSHGEVIDGIPVISMCETPFQGHRAAAKRLTDVVLTVLMLLPLVPVMLVIALLVRLSSPGPIIFRQRRYGLNGEEIIIYKFRTMTVTEDGSTVVQATRSDPRLTRIGSFLRRYSLDELPQLINVLQGRMSLVGPRPHAVAHNELYRKLIKGYMVRHKVRPGITGLAQVHGLRGETRTLEQMEARVHYDLEYLRNWSLELDLEILARTALRVFSDAEAF